jgi:hypothetical protein
MPIRISLLALIALLSLCTRAIAAPSISDREAKSLVEAMWENSLVVLPLGAFTVVRQGHNIDKGSISTKIHEDLIGWEKVGVVSVAADQKYENFKKGKEFSWDQWNQMTLQGAAAKITVTPTESGKRFVDLNNPKRLKFSQGKFTVTNVAKNEERKKGVDDYRLVMVAYNAEWNPLLKQHAQVMGRPLAEKRKAITLFKWDPFTSKWKSVATDIANANEEFKSTRVADALR